MTQAYRRVYLMVQAQAATLAYIDIISYLTLLVVGLIPLVALMRKAPRAQKNSETAMH